MLPSLADLIAADAVLVTDCRGWAREISCEIGDPRVYRADLFGAIPPNWRQHPILSRDLAGPSTGPRRVSELVSRREWHRRELYNEFYRPLGIEGELGTQLAWGPAGSSCCATLHRAGGDFTVRDRALLEAVSPHLRAAWERTAAPRPPAAAELATALPITAREAEVLEQLAAGLTNDGIAQRLGISRHTVVRHVEHIYAKLGVNTRVGAAGVALTATTRS